MRQPTLCRGILILRGKNNRAIGHRNALAGALQNETPFRLLHLRGDVGGLGPRHAVVIRTHEHQLAGLVRLHSRAGTDPRTVAVTPSCCHPNRAGVAIHQNRGIADAVVAPLGVAAHIHNRARRLPRLTAIGAARHAHVYVARQIAPTTIAQIVHANQSSLRRGGQSGDATSMHAALPALPNRHAEAMHCADGRLRLMNFAVGKFQVRA